MQERWDTSQPVEPIMSTWTPDKANPPRTAKPVSKGVIWLSFCLVLLAMLWAVLLVFFALAANGGLGESALMTSACCGAIVVYFVPTITAQLRAHPHTVSISVVNMFLGWTLVGCVVALAWAAMPVKKAN